MRVVIDPNLLVSYLLTHRGPIARIMDTHLAREDFVLLSCLPLLQELKRVIKYPKFRHYFSEDLGNRFLALVASVSELVDLPDEIPRFVRDRKDDYLFACAVIGNANFIITGDKDLLDLRKVKKIRIVTARTFADTILDNLT